MTNKQDLGFAVYERRNDGVVVLKLSEDLSIDAEKAKMMDAALAKITKNIPSKILVVNSRYSTADAEARKILSSSMKKKQIAKAAVTIHTLPQKLLANFFIKVNKPPFPIRFFNSLHEAEEWLKD